MEKKALKPKKVYFKNYLEYSITYLWLTALQVWYWDYQIVQRDFPRQCLTSVSQTGGAVWNHLMMHDIRFCFVGYVGTVLMNVRSSRLTWITQKRSFWAFSKQNFDTIVVHSSFTVLLKGWILKSMTQANHFLFSGVWAWPLQNQISPLMLNNLGLLKSE